MSVTIPTVYISNVKTSITIVNTYISDVKDKWIGDYDTNFEKYCSRYIKKELKL